MGWNKGPGQYQPPNTLPVTLANRYNRLNDASPDRSVIFPLLIDPAKRLLGLRCGWPPWGFGVSMGLPTPFHSSTPRRVSQAFRFSRQVAEGGRIKSRKTMTSCYLSTLVLRFFYKLLLLIHARGVENGPHMDEGCWEQNSTISHLIAVL